MNVYAKARKLARAKFNELWDGSEHPSFAASKALEFAADQVLEPAGIQTFGVEGFSKTGSFTEGISYLNRGDTYDTTLCFQSSRWNVRFFVGSWGDFVESHPGYCTD